MKVSSHFSSQTVTLEVKVQVIWIDEHLRKHKGRLTEDGTKSHAFNPDYLSELWTPDIDFGMW